jgi:predicted ATPase
MKTQPEAASSPAATHCDGAPLALVSVEEQVYRLAPLAIAPAVPDLTAAIAVTYPAVQLFVERVAANGTRLDLADADAPMVARICERLDGVALAIELAAGRVAAYGLGQVAALLDERLSLSWPGHRTAPGRQRTLHATIDWSYRLLPETEQAVLRRLSVFVGPFTLEAAQHVASGAGVDQGVLFDAIDGLVAKSMVAASAAPRSVSCESGTRHQVRGCVVRRISAARPLTV